MTQELSFIFSSDEIMKCFLLRFILCFIIFVVICMIPCRVFEKKARECMDVSPYSEINYIDKLNHADADMVILGNSRAKCGYNDSILSVLVGKNCINLAIPGFSFDFQYNAMYKRYLVHNNKPQYILIDVSPLVFFERTRNSYSLETLPYVGRDDFDGYFNICPGYKIADRIMLVKYFGKLDLVIKQLGKMEKKEEKSKRDETMKSTKINNSLTMPLEYDTTIIRLFCDFLEECVEENVNVIILCSPMYSESGKTCYDMDNFWRIIKYCVSGRKTVAVSYQDLYDSDMSYFADPMHLNSYGRDCFTMKLAHDLDSFNLLK